MWNGCFGHSSSFLWNLGQFFSHPSLVSSSILSVIDFQSFILSFGMKSSSGTVSVPFAFTSRYLICSSSVAIGQVTPSRSSDGSGVGSLWPQKIASLIYFVPRKYRTRLNMQRWISFKVVCQLPLYKTYITILSSTGFWKYPGRKRLNTGESFEDYWNYITFLLS